MDVDPPNLPSKPYTIVRVKRKRNEEPLDALVAESGTRRKKTKNAPSVFKFAETVEQSAWEDAKQKTELEKRLATLAQDSSATEVSGPKAESASLPPDAPPTQPARPVVKATRATRSYTIVQSDRDNLESYHRPRELTAPPKVYSSKELAAMKKAAAFKMYDAVPAPSDPAGSGTSPVDEDMEKFLPMLQDYLRVSDVSAPVVDAPSGEQSDDDDYVYDVFYKPTGGSRDQAISMGGNVATLTGLPPELSGLDHSDSDSDYEDEDDEDSNAEDWYTNDYPEEEESDEFHEDSEYEDDMYGEGRGYQSYRNVMIGRLQDDED